VDQDVLWEIVNVRDCCGGGGGGGGGVWLFFHFVVFKILKKLIEWPCNRSSLGD
jgi:hypothetical protein